MGKEEGWKEVGGRHCIGELKRWGGEEFAENDEAAGAGVLHY